MTGRLLLLALAVLAACGPSEPPARRRVVVVGIDGAEWAVIDRLRAAGRLPVLDGLIARGAHGPLGTFKPTLPLELEDGTTILCFHGSPNSFEDFVFATTADDDLKRMFDGLTPAIVPRPPVPATPTVLIPAAV